MFFAVPTFACGRQSSCSVINMIILNLIWWRRCSFSYSSSSSSSSSSRRIFSSLFLIVRNAVVVKTRMLSSFKLMSPRFSFFGLSISINFSAAVITSLF